MGLAAALGGGLMLGVSVARAQDLPDPPAQRTSDPFALTMIWENDGSYVRPAGTDKHYTNGLLVTLAHQPAWARQLADGLGLDADATAAGYLVAHQIFTPTDLSLNPPDATDRPYAGYLYGGVYWQRELDDALDHVEVDIGVIGPAAGASGLQASVHGTFGGVDPQGWGSQQSNEVTFQTFYRRKWRYELFEDTPDTPEKPLATDPWAWQVIPQVGVALGTVYRNVSAAATLRFGYNTPDDFGPMRIADLGSATGLSRDLARGLDPALGAWSWYVFAQAQAQLVQYNHFIDGSDFNGGSTVDSTPVVGQFGLGGVARYRFSDLWALQFGYSQTLVTQEYTGQSGLDGYGTLMLALRGTFGGPPASGR